MTPLYAVECRSAGYPCWLTIDTLRTEQQALAVKRAVRRLMPTAQHRGTLQVSRYTRVHGTWVREGVG
jgi:hypothetical protein